MSNTLEDNKENLDALKEYTDWCFDTTVGKKAQSFSSPAKNEMLSSKRSHGPDDQIARRSWSSVRGPGWWAALLLWGRAVCLSPGFKYTVVNSTSMNSRLKKKSCHTLGRRGQLSPGPWQLSLGYLSFILWINLSMLLLQNWSDR